MTKNGLSRVLKIIKMRSETSINNERSVLQSPKKGISFGDIKQTCIALVH